MCYYKFSVFFFFLQDLIEFHDLKFYTTSALKGDNVKDTLYKLTHDLVELEDQLSPYLSIDSGPQSLLLHHRERGAQDTYCCQYI